MGKDVLFIALAHGGVAGGMDIFSRYISKTHRTESAMYVLRYSTHKLKEQDPNIAPSEVAYLQEHAEGKAIVVFDEDVDEGTTLRGASSYLSEHIFHGEQVIQITTHDPYDRLGNNKDHETSSG